MKKFLLVLSLLIVSAAAVAGAPLRIDLDDPSRVDVDIDNEILTGLVPGVNSLDIEPGTYVRVMAKEGVMFTEVTLIDDYYHEENSWMQRIDTKDGRQYVDLYSRYPEDEQFRIRTSGAADTRTASCTVTVDDPAMVRLTRRATDSEVALEAGTAVTVKFDPATESEFEIVPVGDKPVYKVTQNDREVASTGYRHLLTVNDGDNIVIQAHFPDQPCTLNFVFADDDARDFIQTVDVEGRPVFDFTDPIEARLGDGLKITGNTNEYEVLEFTVNGTPVMFSNPFMFLLEGDTEIGVSVRKYASFKMKVVVDDPSRIHLYQGYSYNNVEYTLQAGDNMVEVLRNTPIVTMVPADGAYIESAEISGYSYTVEELQVPPVAIGSLQEGEVLTITTGTIVRDMKAVVFVSGLESVADYVHFRRADHTDLPGIAEGYNLIDFYSRDNRFRIETGGPAEAHVYVNGEAADAEFPGSPLYRPELTDGDVLKVYFGDVPALHTISFDVAEDAAGKFTVTADRITPVDASATSLSLHHKSEIAVSAAGDDEIVVSVAGKPVAPQADGSVVLTVEADTALAVSLKNSGIDRVDAEAREENGVLYNLHGQPAGTDPTGLPAGIYLRHSSKEVTKVIVR